MQDLAGIVDPMLHVGWRLGKVRYQAPFRDRIPSFKTEKSCQKPPGAKMNDFRPKPKNWSTRNTIKMQDLAGIIDPMLHVGWRLGKVRYQAISCFAKK